MSSTLVDANIWIDLFDEQSDWRAISDQLVSDAIARGPLIINPLIFAEVAAGYESYEEVDALFSAPFVTREALPWEAAFVAGRVFRRYRQRGGTRGSPLPDFYIGAHALVAGHALLTRDPNRYASYFPKLRVVAP